METLYVNQMARVGSPCFQGQESVGRDESFWDGPRPTEAYLGTLIHKINETPREISFGCDLK